MSGTVSKIAAERNRKALLELAMQPGNGEYRLYLIHCLGGLYCTPLAILAPR